MSIISDEDNNSKIEFNFSFSKDKISKLELNKVEFSRHFTVADVKWKISIRRGIVGVSETHYLQSFLYVDGETKLWCCYVRARLTLVSQKQDVANVSRNIERLFSSACNFLGYSFIEWDKFINPEFGYIQDDTVKFEVHIVADPPQNVDPNYIIDSIEPVKSEGWLSVFEDRINKQIVCRVAEEFKKVVSSVDEGFKSVKSKNNDIQENIDAVQEEINLVKGGISTVEQDISTVKQGISAVKDDVNSGFESVNSKNDDIKGDIDAVQEEMNMFKEEISTVKQDISAVKELVSSVNATIEELKNMLLKLDKKNGATDEENSCKEENEIRKDGVTDSHRNEIVDDFVVRKLSEFENKMMRELFLHRSPEIPPWFRYSEPCFHNNYGRGYNAERDNHVWGKFNLPRESVAHNQFGCATQKKCPVNELGRSTSSSSITCQLHEIEEYLQNYGNENVSTDTSYSVSVHPPTRSNSSIPGEEEALLKMMDLDKPWRKDLFVIVKDGDGKRETHRATTLKELFDLKKKFKDCEVFEAEKI